MPRLKTLISRVRALKAPSWVMTVLKYAMPILKYAWALLKHWWSLSPLDPRRRRPKQRVMKPYVQLDTWWRKIALVITPVVLGGFCLVYGFFFALTAPYLTIFFAAPIALLMMMSIWALPERPHAPTKTLEFLFASTLICLILWPNYLAFALPGLPWITAVRLTATPMALLFFVSLSTSRRFREEMGQLSNAIPGLWVWFAVFVAIQVLTVGFAKSPPNALNKFVIQQQNWTVMAAVAAWVCRVPGRAERYVWVLTLTTLPMTALALLEFNVHHLLWAGYVPSFLKIDDPTAVTIFASQLRAATGQYRTKVTFTTALGMAEYMSLLTPFAIHYALGSYRIARRAFGFILIPVIFYAVRLTDARLGVIGFLVSILLYLLFWGMQRFRRNRRDLLAATVVYAYPAMFLAAALAITSVGPVRALVLGGGAQNASNLARQHQITMAIPKMLLNPIGHGGGGSGAAMGYAADEFIAIDNYYLVMGLDYGMLGLVTFVGVFLLVIGWSVRSALVAGSAAEREITLLVPLAVSMSAFLVIKLVFGQADLHSLMFMMLGIAVALIYRVRQLAEALVRPAQAAQPALTPGDDQGDEARPQGIPPLRPPRPKRALGMSNLR